MMERLFPGEWIPASSQPTVIATPLGDFALELLAEQPLGPHTEFHNAAGDRLLVWRSSTVWGELLIRHLVPELPDGMWIDGCAAAVWRVRALGGELRNYRFRCEAALEFSRLSYGGCSGQGLEAQEWSDGETTVTLGTQDTEAMIGFRRIENLFPALWLRADVAPHIEFVHYKPDGFGVQPPALQVGEQVQIQFVLAWATESHPDASTACWFAVDLAPHQILQR